MKKFLALILTLLMLFAMGFAVAEQTEEVAMEDLFDGVWVQFEDGFELYLPADWYALELTEEWYAKGIFYAAGTEDFAYSCTLAWQPMTADLTLEQVREVIAAEYGQAELIDVNGVGLIVSIDAENNLLNFIALDAAEPGYYLFAFSPADDPDFQLLAYAIAASIRNIQ